jgi:hypothetical protein
MKIRRSIVAGYLILLAAMFSLFLSGAALNNLGLNYSADPYSGGLKLHPYTLLTTVAFLVLVCGQKALGRCLQIRQFRTSVVGAAIVALIVLVKALVGDSQSMGFTVDTIIAAFIMAAALPLVSPIFATRLSTIAFLFLIVECLLAIGEGVFKVNLIPMDVWYGSYFRSTALQGHPLNNALIVVTAAVALQAYARRWTSTLIFCLTVGALLAFGARGALAVYLLVNAITFTRFGLRSAQQVLILIVGGVLAAIGLAWFVFSGVVGDRIAQVGAYDDSTQTRFQALDILTHLNWTQIMLGNGSNAIAHLMAQSDVSVVENFLVGYVLTFGGFLTLVILYCVYRTFKAFLSGVPAVGRRRLYTVLFVFVCTALTNNSLITKTPALYLLMIGLWWVKCRSIAHGSSKNSMQVSGEIYSKIPSRKDF